MTHDGIIGASPEYDLERNLNFIQLMHLHSIK